MNEIAHVHVDRHEAGLGEGSRHFLLRVDTLLAQDRHARLRAGVDHRGVGRLELQDGRQARVVEVAAQGPDPDAWRADATAERIKFAPGLLPFTMRYTNRPTGIQQVIDFTGHR